MASVNWADTQILKLIEIWGEEDIQEQLETTKETSTCTAEWQNNFKYMELIRVESRCVAK